MSLSWDKIKEKAPGLLQPSVVISSTPIHQTGLFQHVISVNDLSSFLKPKPSRQVYTLAIQLMRRDGLLPDPLLFSSDRDWNHKQFHEALKSLSPERRRKARRRFRKAWRVALAKSGKPLSMAPKLSREDKSSLVRDFYLRRAESMVECP